MAAGNHAGGNFSGCDKRAEGVDSPVRFVLIGPDFRDSSECAAASVVEKDFGFPEVNPNRAKSFGYLRTIADITSKIQRRGSALPYFVGEHLKKVRFAREHGDGVGRSEAAGQCSAESGTNPSNDRNRFVRLVIHNTPLCPAGKRRRPTCIL